MGKSVLCTSDRVFFVPKSSDIVDSLFEGPTTASGTFKVKPDGILFHDLKGVARVFLKGGPEPFFVSCSLCTTKSGRKRLSYMYALCALDQLWLDIKGISFSEERYLAASLWSQAQQAAL